MERQIRGKGEGKWKVEGGRWNCGIQNPGELIISKGRKAEERSVKE
jgi:hypothetical protein